MILKTLKERAEAKIGQEVRRAVITVPAYFTDAQRQATKEAGAIAGLEVLRIINEPTAAALAYEAQGAGQLKHIMVYDLGGGTFDVSIVKMEEGVVEVLASAGDNRLGGDDFDDSIVTFLTGQILKEHGRDLSEDKKAMARLKMAAEKAKIALSDSPFTRIEEDHLADGIHLSCEFSRDEFETLVAPLLEKTLVSVATALDDAELMPSDLDEILLVGGSTRIPAVAGMLEDKLGLSPSTGVDPELCVALGAGIQAGREMGKQVNSLLIDITPYTFGTSALGEIDGMLSEDMFVPLIRKNTKLPASRTEAFQTLFDGQPGAEINVYQGENKNALENVFIDRYLFDLSELDAGSVITLRYDLDLNGILKLEAVEKQTGRKINAVMENVFSASGTEDLDRSREKVQSLFGEKDVAASPPEDVLPEAISRVLEQAMEKLDTAPDEDRDEIINLMEEIKTLAGKKDFHGAEAVCDELDDILFYLD